MNNENENITEQSVTAIAKSNNKLKAVELSKQDGAIEVIMTKSSDENVVNWQEFATECGLSTNLTTQDDAENQKACVVGYDSAGTAFSRVDIPDVEDKEIDAMVQLQAESRLPLPANQMELAWRADRMEDGQLAVTIAAARSPQIYNFIEKIMSFKPANIFLDCEGIVQAWKEVFSGSAEKAVIINAGARNTQICQVNQGRLINAVALDTGMDDFDGTDSDEEAETIERFIQDTRSVVDLFGFEKPEKLPVFVLSDGSEAYTSLVSSLKSAGLNAILSSPNTKKFKAKSKLDIKDIFEYRLPIGLALMVINSKGDDLNLFNRLYQPFGEEEKKHWLYSTKITGAIAVAALLLCVAVWYTVDAVKADSIRKHIESPETGLELEQLVEKQTIIEKIEAQRPDLLELINFISLNSNDPRNQTASMNQIGIQLDSFDFKRGKKVTITGQADDNQALYDFEVELLKQPNITDVEWDPTKNRSISSNRNTTTSRTNGNTRGRNTTNIGRITNQRIQFTMTLHYKRFTKSGN